MADLRVGLARAAVRAAALLIAAAPDAGAQSAIDLAFTGSAKACDSIVKTRCLTRDESASWQMDRIVIEAQRPRRESVEDAIARTLRREDSGTIRSFRLDSGAKCSTAYWYGDCSRGGAARTAFGWSR